MLVLLVLNLVPSWSMLKGGVLKYKYYNSKRVQFLKNYTNSGDVVIFRSNPLMEHCGPLFFERIFIVSKTGGRDLEGILESLKERGLHYCYYWTMNSGFGRELSEKGNYRLTQETFKVKRLPYRHYLVKIEF